MVKKQKIKAGIKDGLTAGFPIVFGYLPVAMAFGLLSRNTGISLKDSAMFSILVYAGASQFMAIDLIKSGLGAGNIILATFLLNLRHLMMSASLSIRIKEIKRKWLIFIAFGVTDETFSIISLGDKELTVPFLLTVNSLAYFSWVSGTVLGYLIGNILPAAIQSCLGIGLYAMFIALLMPEVKKSSATLAISLLAAMLYGVLDYFKVISSSSCIIAAIVIASFVGALIFRNTENEVKLLEGANLMQEDLLLQEDSHRRK
ncbi:MAG TPA: AzlC family ABC transporter permease [Clostridiaceae bacterium]